MSVNLYTGVPGSGKSLHATAKILEYLKAGRDVIANYPIIFKKREIKKGLDQHFWYYKDEDWSVSMLLRHARERGYLKVRKEKQCLLVIDEAAYAFNCRDFGDKSRRKWLDLFRIHRKLGYDCILVAQQDKMLDKQIRGIVEQEFHHRKASHVVWWLAISPLKLFVAKQYFYGMTPKQATGSEWFVFRKSLGARYDTYALFDLDEVGLECQPPPVVGAVRGRGSLAPDAEGATAQLKLVTSQPEAGSEHLEVAEL